MRQPDIYDRVVALSDNQKILLAAIVFAVVVAIIIGIVIIVAPQIDTGPPDTSRRIDLYYELCGDFAKYGRADWVYRNFANKHGLDIQEVMQIEAEGRVEGWPRP